MELRLDSNLHFSLTNLSPIKDGSQMSSKLDEYVERLEDEMRKIKIFNRELPLCMIILKDAIERLKKEVMQCGEMEDRLVIEEFIPLKKGNSVENGGVVSGKENSDMKSWMSKYQL